MISGASLVHPSIFLPFQSFTLPHLPFAPTTITTRVRPSHLSDRARLFTARYLSRQWRERGNCQRELHAWRESARNGPRPPQSLRISHRRRLLQPQSLRNLFHDRSVRANRCRRWTLLSQKICQQKNTNPSLKGLSFTSPTPHFAISSRADSQS